MNIPIQTYQSAKTLVHRCDPRVKIVLLLAYSVSLFVVTQWVGLGVCLLLFLVVVSLANVSMGSLLRMLVPLYVLLGFVLLFNSFTFDPARAAGAYGIAGVSAGIFEGYGAVPLVGTLAFVPEGFARACFYVLRILLLVLMSLVMAYTTPAVALTEAIAWFLSPLRRLRVPVDDIAMAFSIALRFIPLCIWELDQVKMAQSARYASLGMGGVIARFKAWAAVLVPLFVSVYRNAATMAAAMDARCYGVAAVRTQLHPFTMRAADWASLVVGLAVLITLCLYL